MNKRVLFLDEIRRRFLCCSKINDSEWKFVAALIEEDNTVQDELLNVTINEELVLKYPLKVPYQIAFLKHLKDELECKNCEVSDALYEGLCNLLTRKATEVFYKHYIVGKTGCRIIIRENGSIISNGTTGLQTWEASMALAEWAVQNKDKLCNKSILELGSGIGLTGLVIHKICQPKDMFLSDCHPLVLESLCHNVKLNIQNGSSDGSDFQKTTDELHNIDISSEAYAREKLGDIELFAHHQSESRIKVLNLPWENVTFDVCQPIGKVDLVIGSDIIFDSSTFQSLLSAMSNLSKHCFVKEFIFACTVRNQDTLGEFLQFLGKQSFEVSELALPVSDNFVWSSACEIKIFSVKR